MNDQYDYLIIGSGFGGSVAALRLAEKGYSVALIEQGRRFNAGDFPKTNWNLRKYLWLPSLGFYGIQKLSFYRQASILTGTGYGGGSLVYANTLFKPSSRFFSNGPWKNYGNWEELLEPFYEKAAFMMGRTLYDRRDKEDDLLRQVAVSLNRENTFQNVYVGVNFSDKEESDPYFSGKGPVRNPCTYCAACMTGCRENAKNTLDKNYLYFAEKSGLKVFTETVAYRLSKEDGYYVLRTKSLTGFIKEYRNFRAKQVIISAGVLNTLKFLFEQKFKYRTLPLLPDSLGENLLTNSETLTAVSGVKYKLNNGIAISSVFHPDEDTSIEIVKYPDGSNLMKIFFTLAAGKTGSNLKRSLNLLGIIISKPIRFLKTLLSKNWSTGTVIFLVMQTLHNSMKMKWGKGIFRNRMYIENSGDQRVPAYIDIGQKVTEKYALLSGGTAQNILLEIFLNRPTTAHILGGCPMSDNPGNGVIKPNFEVHGYPGLYILDGSVIQSNPGVNPSFSILAVSEYAMSLIP